MAIKKLTFTFEVPITQLLGLIATGNSGLKIDVMGDDKVHPIAKALNGAHPAMKLLEGPKAAKPAKAHGVGTGNGPRQRGKDGNGEPITAYNAILRALAKASDHEMQLAELRTVVGGTGLSPSSANSQISLMRTRGIARRAGEGVYQLTARGLAEAEKRGLVKAHPKAHPKPKPPKKKPPAPAPEAAEPAPVAAEQDHG
jgi:hypothetical protein